MGSSDNASLQTVPVEIRENVSILLIEYALPVPISYQRCTAQSLDTIILHLH